MLSNVQKIRVRHFLGYPGIAASAYKPELVSAFQLLDSDADAEAYVISILERLETVETELDEAALTGGFKKVDEIEFAGMGATLDPRQTLLQHGKRLVAKLSSFLGVSVGSNVFGTFGYEGHAWAWHPLGG